MAVEEESTGVRLHVGGLPRGVHADELAALIARALPGGVAAPTAEIMRDSTTGIERGFGYVTVAAGGHGVKAGAERAIVAYNGTRWRGSKIRVGFAKGDYKERLRGEWEEASAKAGEWAQKWKNLHKAASSQEDRPFLRLRRRPGERVILVDPKPVPWETQTWQKAGFLKKKGGDASVEEGRDGEEAGGHRRKRGVLGCRRRVTFPGGGMKMSTTCREIWRKHLQEMAADAKAAKKRSAVERLVMSEGRQQASLPNQEAETEKNDVLLSSSDRRKGGANAKDLDMLASDVQPVGPRGKDEVDQEGEEHDSRYLEPEESPGQVGIEFVWDDAGEDMGDEAQSKEESRSPLQEEYDSEVEEGGVEDDDREEDAEETEEEEEIHGEGKIDAHDIDLDKEGDEETSDDEATGVCNAEEQAERRRDRGVRPAVDKRGGGERAAKDEGVASIGKKLSRLSSKHGLEIDDRLAEFFSDEEDADGDGGAFDYELETAKRAGAAVNGSDNASEVARAVESEQEKLEGMSERLQTETKRALDLLAEVLGGAHGRSSVVSPKSAPTPAAKVNAEESVLDRRLTTVRSGGVAEDGKHSTISVLDVAEAGDDAQEAKRREKRRKSEMGDKEGNTSSISNEATENRINSVIDRTTKITAGLELTPSEKTSESVSGSLKATQERFLSKERFVTHMSTLTDIFKVQDKASTKKNSEEKERDKGFKVTSLFGGLAEGSGSVAAPGESSTEEGFSFSFGDAVGQTGQITPEAGVRESSGVEAERPPGEQAWFSAERSVPQEGVDLHGADGKVAPERTTDDGGGGASDSARQRSAPAGRGIQGIQGVDNPDSIAEEAIHDGEVEKQTAVLWCPLEDVVAIATRFVRSDKREDVEATWLGERRALTQDFKRKHKDAVKGKRGFGARVGGGAKRSRR